MVRKASRFKVGLFVIIGVIMAMAALVYLGAHQYFDSGKTYVTYFNESVQGLQRDSVVKYLGVSVGRVKSIRVAPDYDLIEVVMDISFEGDLPHTMVAELKSVGITGIVFVELTRRDPEAPDLSPRIDFAAEHPIIPSRPSNIAQIITAVDRVTRQLSEINFKQLAKKVDRVLDTSQKLIGSEKLAQAITSLSAAAKQAEALAKEARKKLAALDAAGLEQGAKGALGQTRRLMLDSRRMVAQIRAELKGMNLPRIGSEAAELTGALRETTLNLTRASRNLENLLERLERSPSDLLFGGRPEPRKVE